MTHKRLFIISLLIAVLLLTASDMHAQAMHITGTLQKSMKSMSGGKSERMALSVPVHIFDNAAAARRERDRYKAASRNFGTDLKIQGNDYVVPDYEGHFEADVASTGALLIVNEGKVTIVDIDPKKLQYDITLESGDDGILISNVDVYGKRQGVSIKALPPVDEGPVLHWNVTMSLPAYYTGKNTRLIFQPVVIDCQTEDTLQYLEPLVYEGKAYHANQIRRKSYDYMRNDSLSPYYISQPATTSSPFTFTWNVAYAKPDFTRTYKWGSVLQIEDYTHVVMRDDTKQGTCNSRKPWKMLDVSMARKEMPLDERFYEQARSLLRQIPRDLQLTFMQGRDVLTADLANQYNVKMLVRELRSYGKSLMSFAVQGTASPEGNEDINRQLAEKRSRKALNMIGSYIRTAGLKVKAPLIYTWNDVADSLQARGLTSEAQELRSLANNNKQTAIRKMRDRVPVIDEIMQNQRLMKCSYTIRQNKILDPSEVLWTYYNDKSFAVGGENVFSNGDYYNLFKQIKDSAELQRLTQRAWAENRVRRTMKYSAFAAYLANRVACDAIAKDSIDLSILAPFIDMKSGPEVKRPIAFDNSYMYTVNRLPIVANQAIMYFKKQRLGEAAHLVQKLPDTDDYRSIKMFTDLETLFFKSNRTPDEDRRAKEALAYAMGTSRMNNAVLQFELASELGKTYEEIMPLVDSLPDNAPQKWYMKGVMASSISSESSDADFMSLVEKYGTEKALKMLDNTTPEFLAYFQHCFDLAPDYYKKYYITDANISDEIRKKYPYDPKKADVYREKFESLSNITNKDSKDKATEEKSEEKKGNE